MWGLVDFTLNNILPVPEVKAVLELRAWQVQILSPISESVPRPGQEDLSPGHPHEDWLLMEGQYPSLPNMVATTHPGRPSAGPPLGFPPMVTDVKMPPLVSIPSEEPLHAVVEPVAMYSTLVYRSVVTGKHGIMAHTLVASGEGCLISGPWSYDH